MPRTYPLPACDVPIYGEADVLVCGGGPAGFSAGLAAARAGHARCWSCK